jgi:hypothetical protein
VKIKDNDLQTTSNDSGYYILRNIKPGIHSIQVNMIGYKQITIDNFRVDSVKNYNVDFILTDEWDCYKYVDSAKNDIQDHKAKILLAGLLILTEETKIPDEKIREITKKYGFEYKDVGCTFTCSSLYNEIIMEYLIERNGKDWEEKFNEEIRMLKVSYFIK